MSYDASKFKTSAQSGFCRTFRPAADSQPLPAFELLRDIVAQPDGTAEALVWQPMIGVNSTLRLRLYPVAAQTGGARSWRVQLTGRGANAFQCAPLVLPEGGTSARRSPHPVGRRTACTF